MVAEAPTRPRVRLVVFSASVDWRVLEDVLSEVGDDRLCVVTTHRLFPHERQRLCRMAMGAWEFRTFHDLLDAQDMEYCDEQADHEVVARLGHREGAVVEYFATIRRLKNRRAAERLTSEFEVHAGAVLSGDLGIETSVWVELGLCDCAPSRVVVRRPLWARLHRMFSGPLPFHYLHWMDQCWLLVGRPERIGQYLDKGAVDVRPVGRLLAWWLNLQVLAGARDSWLLKTVSWASSLARGWARRSVSQVATTVHEDSPAIAVLSKALGLDHVNLQDSFLPEYYPSRYLLYRPWVRRFYVWDRLSRGVFNRYGLESVVWAAYRSWALPPITADAIKQVRRIVYLASGAGDWTALKNRSDEDLALALLIEVARLRPDLTIYYRPHPLWLHPEHQGLNSIERAMTCIVESGVPNIMVSQGASIDGRRFSKTHNLSAVSSSVDEDIAWADLVLGEHSQTMLVAARRGKIIAGIDVSRHPAYFRDYAELGFPLLSSATDLVALVDRMTTDGGFLKGYNEAIERHNRTNCAPDGVGSL